MVEDTKKKQKARIYIAKRRLEDPIQNSLYSVNSQRRVKGKKPITRSQLQEYLNFCFKAKLFKDFKNRRSNNGKFSIDTFLLLKKQNLLVL